MAWAGGESFFVASVSRFDERSNWAAAWLGVRRDTPVGVAVCRAGLSAAIGYVVVQLALNLLLPVATWNPMGPHPPRPAAASEASAAGGAATELARPREK